MPVINLEASIIEFLALGRRLQAMKTLTCHRVLDELTSWYQRTRVEGALPEEDDDMLLLQWGAIRPFVFAQPTDLRGLSDEEIKYSDTKVKYLDFTRQVLANKNDEEQLYEDFIHMSITLAFAEADGSELTSHQWIHKPNDIDGGLEKFLQQEFVQSLIEALPRFVSITVDSCG